LDPSRLPDDATHPRRKHPGLGMALFLLALTTTSPTQASKDARQQELQDLRHRIEQLREDLEQASGDRSEAADSLKTSERRISQVNRELRELRQKHDRLLADLKTLEKEALNLQARLEQQESRLAELLRERYQHPAEDTSKLLLNGQSPAEIARQMEYFGYVGRARARLIAEHKATLERLAEVRANAEERQAALNQVSETREAQKKTLEREKAERQQVLAQLSDKIRLQRREISTLQRDEQRLGRLIEKLRNLARSKKSKPSSPLAKPKTDTVTQVASAKQADVAFGRLKGKLALPVAGDIVSRYGEARPDGGPAWKGLFIRARPGQEVRAVATGEVVFSEWLRGFGNLLILDHGGGYLSLYSNNESLYKQPGEDVRAGDVVASIGNTGGQASPGLYFELRHQGKPFDPMTWVARK